MQRPPIQTAFAVDIAPKIDYSIRSRICRLPCGGARALAGLGSLDDPDLRHRALIVL